MKEEQSLSELLYDLFLAILNFLWLIIEAIWSFPGGRFLLGVVIICIIMLIKLWMETPYSWWDIRKRKKMRERMVLQEQILHNDPAYIAKQKRKATAKSAAKKRKATIKKNKVAALTKIKISIRSLIKKHYVIFPCTRCSDKKFEILEFNSLYSSVHVQCNGCNKKRWCKRIKDDKDPDIDKLKELWEDFSSEYYAVYKIYKDEWALEQGINISSNSENIIKTSRSRAIPQDVMDRVWNRDGGKCKECGSNENIEFDHIIPFSKGGANTYKNIQILCEPCNRSKSDKIG